MKLIFNVAVLLVTSAFILTNCTPEYKGIDCEWEGVQIVEKSYGSGPDSTVRIYPVITTNNYDFCDSMVYDPITNDWVAPWILDPSKKCTQQQAIDSIQAGNFTACPCRENPDKINDQINSKFFIENVGEKETFKYNQLFIRVLNDTIKIRHYEDYDNNKNVFQGFVPTDTELGYYEYYTARVLASGVYEYELVLYKDSEHTVPFDTITDKFIIITSRMKDDNRNCKDLAKDSDDPLLK